MKTVFVLYMLTLNYGQTPHVTNLDTFDSLVECIKTSDALRDFYSMDKLKRYEAGFVGFKCIEKNVQSDGCKSGE